jgi:hypothetical protein
VLTQAIELTSDVKFRALFGIQSKLDFGFKVGAGVAWVPGNGPFYTGHLEGIGYHEGTATWGGNISESGSLLQRISEKLRGDPSSAKWLFEGALKLVPVDIHYQLQLYGVVGADLALHIPYFNFQAIWKVNSCTFTLQGRFGVEGELEALVSLPTKQKYKTPLQIGYEHPMFEANWPFPGIGCPSSSSNTPTTEKAPSTSTPTKTPTTTQPGSQPGPTPPGSTPPGPSFFVYHVHESCSGSVCGINERAGPGFGYQVVGGKAEGAEVDIVCQTTGDMVSGTIGGSSNIWDRLTDGNYVADLFVDTPGVGVFSDPPIPHC